jgi:hypothetical protein
LRSFLRSWSFWVELYRVLTTAARIHELELELARADSREESGMAATRMSMRGVSCPAVAAVTEGWGHAYISSAARSYPDLPERERAELDEIGRQLVEKVRTEFPDGWEYGTPLATTLRQGWEPRWMLMWQIDFQYPRVYVTQISEPVG